MKKGETNLTCLACQKKLLSYPFTVIVCSVQHGHWIGGFNIQASTTPFLIDIMTFM